MPRCLSVPSAEAGCSERTNHHLALYSMAAAAAGVSLLALAQPAEGSVVVTKTNIAVNFGYGASIDLNKDGTNDFTIFAEGGAYDHSFWGTFVAIPLTGGKVVGATRGALGPYASALGQGANIGPSAHFSSSIAQSQITIERSNGSASAGTHRTYYGKWAGVSNHYLGVKFLINGATHYGWIRLSVSLTGRLSGTITEYAYETVANKKITAGATTGATIATDSAAQPTAITTDKPSLGVLALGADGLNLWRRDENP